MSKKYLLLSQKWGKIYLKVEQSGVKWCKVVEMGFLKINCDVVEARSFLCGWKLVKSNVHGDV